MTLSRRILGIGGVLLVLTLLGGGIYLRVSGDDGPSAEGGAFPGGAGGSGASDAAATPSSAASAFNTEIAIPVQGAEVLRDTLVLSVQASGDARAARRVTIPARVEGRIDAMPVRDSDFVSDGAPLIRLDARDYELGLREAEAQLRQREAQYRELMLFADRIEDAGARAERERTARARSGLDAAEIQVERARLALERTRIDAPFAGQVASVRVVAGQSVAPGDELLTVVDLDPIKVEVQVLEGQVGRLAPGRAARVSFAAFPDTTFVGRIRTINPLVDPESRTARVTVAVPNPDGRILPGMYARVSLEARRLADRILVPRSTILERGAERRTMLFVYEPNGDGGGLAKWRYVTTGLQNDSLVEIVPHPETEMVEPGEVVLTDGHYTLVHDARIRLVEDVGAAGGRPQ